MLFTQQFRNYSYFFICKESRIRVTFQLIENIGHIDFNYKIFNLLIQRVPRILIVNTTSHSHIIKHTHPHTQ